MTKSSKSLGRFEPEAFFARNPVINLETWAKALGGHRAKVRAREMSRYYTARGRLRRLTRGLYVVVPPGTDVRRFVPDPYLVAAALREDAVLSHHTALELHGVARSVFHRHTYLSASVRRPLRFRGTEWHALAHPRALARAGKTGFGVVTLDRRGVRLRVTGPERTVVDGFDGLAWVGGLDEHVESSAAFRDLDVERMLEYLALLGKRILFGAIGWFLEGHPETWSYSQNVLARLAARAPGQPLYLGARRRGSKLVSRWNILLPEHLSTPPLGEGARAFVT